MDDDKGSGPSLRLDEVGFDIELLLGLILLVIGLRIVWPLLKGTSPWDR